MFRGVRDRVRQLRARRHEPSDQDAEDARQPGVFRNRTLNYPTRPRDHGNFLSIFSTKALRLHRRTPDKPHPSVDRPLVVAPSPDPLTLRVRNEDSFSSLPSTHASRDPFLNDDVPVEISRKDGRHDRPRRREDDIFVRGLADARSNPDQSPPASLSSSGTLRKRCSLWKPSYDPQNEHHTPHERDILRAVALSEAAVKDRSVRAAHQLVALVDVQIHQLDDVVTAVHARVENARQVAETLPSTRDPPFQPLLHTPGDLKKRLPSAAKADAERVFHELHWTERVWDLEGLLAEKRYEDGVATVEKLNADGVATSGSARTAGKFQSLSAQLVAEMSLCCAQGGSDKAAVFAPLLGRLGKASHARKVILDSAAADLISELKHITSVNPERTPRSVNIILDITLAIYRRAHDVYSKVSSRDSHDSSSFVAWLIEQTDIVYKEFVSPVLAKMDKADPVTILSTIEATRNRRLRHGGPRSATSLVALLETRVTSHVKKDLESPIREAERQLVESAQKCASAIPDSWRDGPYESGKAMCDELNAVSKGLENSIMNLGAEADLLSGNLLVRPALIYCTTLLDIGTEAVVKDDALMSNDVQQGMFETVTIIGKTLLRLHQKFTNIPLLEKVAKVLTNPNLGEVRVLQAEMIPPGPSSPSSATSKRTAKEHVKRIDESGGSLFQNAKQHSPAELLLGNEMGLGILLDRSLAISARQDQNVISLEEQAKRLLAEQRAMVQ